MEKNEMMGGKLVTEQDMICFDCIWRAEYDGKMPPTKCLEYPNGKPLTIVANVPGVECKAKVTEEAFRNEIADE